MERRKLTSAKGTALPVDFLKMVKEVFTANFDQGLKKYAELSPDPYFEATGGVFSDEVILSVTLFNGDKLAATTVHGSTDFDPKASQPTAQDLLGACVDAVGEVYRLLLDPKKPERIAQLAEESLSAFEEIPFEWTPVDVDRHRVFLRVDKSNPKLDQMADDWLAKNDPESRAREEEERRETEGLFVTGPKKPGGAAGPGSGMAH